MERASRRSYLAWPVSRGRAELQGEWAEFLGQRRFALDTFFTLTYSDEYAKSHFIYSETSSLNNFERWVKDMAFPGNYFACAEPHFSRDTPHLHGLLESRGLPLSVLWGDWFRSRGRGRLDPPRSDAAYMYCTKYALKESTPDNLRFRLEPRSRQEQSSPLHAEFYQAAR